MKNLQKNDYLVILINFWGMEGDGGRSNFVHSKNSFKT